MLCYCLQLAVLFISVNLCTSSINNAEFINLKLPCDVFKHALLPSFFFNNSSSVSWETVTFFSFALAALRRAQHGSRSN